MEGEGIAPVYLEKLKGARLVYYRDGDNASNKAIAVYSQVSVGLVLVILCCLYARVWDSAWKGQSLYATIAFCVALAQILTLTYRFSGGSSTRVCTCDHIEQHNGAWRDKESVLGDGIIEAGTVVNWGLQYANGAQKFHSDNLESDSKVVNHLLQIQWDCGYRKVYSKRDEEWKLLRVFDMGPTGIYLGSP